MRVGRQASQCAPHLHPPGGRRRSTTILHDRGAPAGVATGAAVRAQSWTLASMSRARSTSRASNMRPHRRWKAGDRLSVRRRSVFDLPQRGPLQLRGRSRCPPSRPPLRHLSDPRALQPRTNFSLLDSSTSTVGDFLRPVPSVFPPPRCRSGRERVVRWHVSGLTRSRRSAHGRSQGARWVCGAGARCRHNGFGSYCFLAVRLSGLQR